VAPTALLPFDMAGWVFTCASLVAFGAAAVALVWSLPWLASAGLGARIAAALAMGLYPPVVTSVLDGQVNLLVLGLLVLGVVYRRRPGRAGMAFGLAAVSKRSPDGTWSYRVLKPGAGGSRLVRRGHRRAVAVRRDRARATRDDAWSGCSPDPYC
jgi:hypothetical protein